MTNDKPESQSSGSGELFQYDICEDVLVQKWTITKTTHDR